jgi:hypothetical protein
LTQKELTISKLMIRIQVFTLECLEDVQANCWHDKVGEHQQVSKKYVSSRLDLTLPGGFAFDEQTNSKNG